MQSLHVSLLFTDCLYISFLCFHTFLNLYKKAQNVGLEKSSSFCKKYYPVISGSQRFHLASHTHLCFMDNMQGQYVYIETNPIANRFPFPDNITHFWG